MVETAAHIGGHTDTMPAPAARTLPYALTCSSPRTPPPHNRQVTLFRVHKHFITPEAHFWRQKYKLGDSAGGGAGQGWGQLVCRR